MIEAIIIGDCMMRFEEAEAEARRQWWEEYKKESPEMQRIMWDVRRKMDEEKKVERRHQEQVRAQHAIADAIRYAARPRY